jgi:hypothetical protein
VLAACSSGAGARDHALARTSWEGQALAGAASGTPDVEPTAAPGPPPVITAEVAEAFHLILARAPVEQAQADAAPRPGGAMTPCAMAAGPGGACDHDGLWRGLVLTRRPRGYVGGAGSLLPNVGARVFGGWVVGGSCREPTSIEAGLTWQFFDDEAVTDDGNPAAGDWLQADVGIRLTEAYGAAHRSVVRLGASYVHAEGEPNILQFPGDYFGGYAGLGFETDLSESISVGPELTVHALTRNGSFTHGIVPQLTWRLTWWIGGTPSGGDACRLPGEVYASAVALVGPGLGGGIELGQRLFCTKDLDWSFEVLAGAQSLTDGALLARDDGEAAFLRGSVKWTTAPRQRTHLTARLGLGWFRTTAPLEGVAIPGDYVGATAGVGFEFDVGRHLRMGPEIGAWIAAREGTTQFEVLPQFTWRFTVLL